MIKLYKILGVVVLMMGLFNGFPAIQSKELSRWKWEVWDEQPTDENFLQIYLFNITNPDEFENDNAVPILQEIGPIVFREKREKVSRLHHELNHTASYHLILTYEFVPEMSKGNQDDLITTINIPYLSFGKKLAELPFVGSHFKSLIKSGEKLVRRSEKIGDFLYHGIEVKPYMKILDILSPEDIPEQFSGGKFGLFKGRNGSDEGEFIVETGEGSQSSYGKILAWKGQQILDKWDGDFCNMINGTDGTVFDPKNMEKFDVRVFIPDACRSLDYNYDGEVEYDEIIALKYTFRKNLLEDPRKSDDTKCFCVQPDEEYSNCLRKGIMDISPCRDGAPISLSYPHFMNSDDYYSQKVKGLKPNIEIHESYMIVEPKTGTVLEDKKRFQLNMVMKPTPGITALKKLPDMLFPVMWSDKTYKLDTASFDELKKELKKHTTDGPAWHSPKVSGKMLGATEPKTNRNSASNAQSSSNMTMGILLLSSILITKYLYHTSSSSRSA